MKKPDYKGHDSLAEMVSTHVAVWLKALEAQKTAALDNDDRSYFDHEITALSDIKIACDRELGK